LIRGLKPTAKFICRYAAKMRLQPQPTAHGHGFLSYGLNSTVADATENDWWATVIRGLKPTAKFICRYAAKMRLQPQPTAHGHGFLSYGLNSTVADATGTIGGDRDPWVETHGKIHLPLRGKNAVATHNQRPTAHGFPSHVPRVSVPRPRVFVPRPNGFPPHGVGIPKSASLHPGNPPSLVESPSSRSDD
jgi:hypothetical protein